MKTNLNSTAPHAWPAADWAPANEQELVLYHNASSGVEVGMRRWHAGSSDFSSESDTLCFIQKGRGEFRRDSGEQIEAAPGAAIHFKQGWRGKILTSEPVVASYMTCAGGPSGQTPVLREVMTAAPLKDWGVIPTMIQGRSVTAGLLLSREPDGRAESGIWTCTPGVWRCEVTSDEYCHFLAGSCTYTHDGGDVIEIAPDTLAFFPCGWKGTCEVRQTMRKVYMIR